MIYDIKVVGTNSATEHLKDFAETGVNFSEKEGGVVLLSLSDKAYQFSNCKVWFREDGLIVSGLLANKGVVGRIAFHLTNPQQKNLDNSINN